MIERSVPTIAAKKLADGLAAIERHLPYVKNALALNALPLEKQGELACLLIEMGELLKAHASQQAGNDCEAEYS